MQDPEYAQYGPLICRLSREQWESYNFPQLPDFEGATKCPDDVSDDNFAGGNGKNLLVGIMIIIFFDRIFF